ncbi:MAG: ABC transporter ATP-binding protein [Gemmatimonadaceae bacterium]|nr:ABC transporter ATP-binding protein [Gemmatimonadaceae bacterium]
MTPIVHLDAVSVERSGVRVIHGISFAVSRGSWFGLIGANGSGKSTLLRAVAGRLPFAGGSCRIDGDELSMDRAARATRFGFAPPTDTLPDALRVRELLELIGGSVDHFSPRMAPLRTALGLDALLDRWIGDCSAGTRQRIAIMLAFVGDPAFVVLDEPFNWLDPVASFDLRHALRVMVDGGLTLMTALHDLGTLASACDTGLVLADGKVAMALDEELLRSAARNPQAFEQRTIELLRANSALAVPGRVWGEDE